MFGQYYTRYSNIFNLRLNVGTSQVVFHQEAEAIVFKA